MTKNTKHLEQNHRDQAPVGTHELAEDRSATGLPDSGLVVVATPIGNLGDLSPRAKEALGKADVIACEDTRRTGALCHNLEISTKRVVVHDHNEREQIAPLLARIASGELVALVSDAGTPGINDPGHHLINAVINAEQPITAVPGPVAAITALTISGLPTDRFTYEGFLPRKAGQRASRLQDLRDEPRTMIFYLAPHRTHEDLVAMAEVFGADRPACLARELTKRFEECIRLPLGELAERYSATPPKGEVVLVVGGATHDPSTALTDDEIMSRVQTLIRQGMRKKEAAKQVAAQTGRSANTIYASLLDNENPSE